MSTHSPWPWVEEDAGMTPHTFIDDANGKPVATVWDRANAPVIKAAPQLLAVCEFALKEIKIVMPGRAADSIIRKLQAVIAIAKAKGTVPHGD